MSFAKQRIFFVMTAFILAKKMNFHISHISTLPHYQSCQQNDGTVVTFERV